MPGLHGAWDLWPSPVPLAERQARGTIPGLRHMSPGRAPGGCNGSFILFLNPQVTCPSSADARSQPCLGQNSVWICVLLVPVSLPCSSPPSHCSTCPPVSLGRGRGGGGAAGVPHTGKPVLRRPLQGTCCPRSKHSQVLNDGVRVQRGEIIPLLMPLDLVRWCLS